MSDDMVSADEFRKTVALVADKMQKFIDERDAEIERLRDELIRTRAERDHAQVQADHLAQRLVKEARRG